MAALRALQPETVEKPETVDYLRVPRRERLAGALREIERGLGVPPFPVAAAAVIGWAVIAYAVVETALR